MFESKDSKLMAYVLELSSFSLNELSSSNKISKVYGILNGTSNYILTEMENSNLNFPEVFKKAQKLGYAEPGNSKLDLNRTKIFTSILKINSSDLNNNSHSWSVAQHLYHCWLVECLTENYIRKKILN